MSKPSTNVLVLGAGVVGFGVCDAWLKEDDNGLVIVVDKSETQVAALMERLHLAYAGNIVGNRIHSFVGDISSAPQQVKENVLAVLAGRPLHHVVTALGCSSPTVALSDDDPHTFFCLWSRRLSKEAALRSPATLNHFGTILNALTKDTPWCRANTICCHYAIGYPSDLSASSFGPLLDTDFGPVTDAREWGKAFVRVAKGRERLGFICMHDSEETAVLVASDEWVWFPDQHKYGPKQAPAATSDRKKQKTDS